MSQTSYATKQSGALVGMLADLGSHDIVSLKMMDDDSPFGVAVARVDEENEQCTAVTATGDMIRGVVVRSDSYDNAALAGADGVPEGALVNVLRKGRIWAICVDGCDDNDAVFVVHAGGGFRATDDAGNASALANGVARWRSDAGAGELAILEVDFTAHSGAMT